MNAHQEAHPLSLDCRLKPFLFLCLPILITTFSSYLFLLVEKLFLARLSAQIMEAAVTSAYACQIFQAPAVLLTMMAQVHVGHAYGARDEKAIGPCIWQFIWFSLLSALLVIPIGLLVGHIYFHGSELESIVSPYYKTFVFSNFLYPLGASLSCFYFGRRKTRLVMCATIGTQLFKILLAYPLIFGWEGVFSGLGLLGGAISTVIAQLGYCLFLLITFLHKDNANRFSSRNWHFQSKLFWQSIQPGVLRALSKILVSASWICIARLMLVKGGDYLLVLSIGGAAGFFLNFISDAVCQAQITVISNILGAKAYHLLGKAFRLGALVIGFTIVLSAPPFLLFPATTYHYLFPSFAPLSTGEIYNTFLGLWLSFAFFSFCFIPISYILAFKDTKFSLYMALISWINGFLLMYLAIDILKISADLFWLVLSLMHGSALLLYLWRMRWLTRQLTAPIDIKTNASRAIQT